jgi:uncharacterized phage protein gp47/JayE
VEDTALAGTPGETIAVRCVQPGPGPVQAAPNTITRIIDVVAGLTSVTNALPAVPGQTVQGDRDLRLARLQLLQAGGRGPIGAIYAAVVRALPAGYFVGAVENTGDTAVLIDSTPVGAHAHAIVVYPAPTSAEADAVRLAILQTRPAGGRSSGDQVGSVTDPETGYTTNVGFYVAQPLPMVVEVTLDEVDAGYDVGEVGAAARAAVQGYFATLRVGDDVRLLKMQRALAAVDGLLTVGLRINVDGGGFAAADAPVGEFHIATLTNVVIL